MHIYIESQDQNLVELIDRAAQEQKITEDEDIKELKEMFQALDRDGNGTISFAELEEGLGERENREELMALLKAADTDGNGTINYSGKKDMEDIINHH